MRLLSVIHGPAFGGAHNQLLRLAAPLRELGYETTALLPLEAEPAATRIRAADVDAVTVPLRRLRASADPREQLRFLRSLRADVATVRAVAGRVGADLVQVHGPTNPQGAIAARALGAAVVWQLLDSRTPPALRRLSMPYVVRRADAITSWGEALAREHPGAERLGERLVPVFPPVDAAELAPDPERRRRARERLAIDGDRLAIGTVGVLNPQKGHEHLIRAFGRIAARRPDVDLRILGAPSPAHGRYRARLERERGELGLGAGERLRIDDPGGEVPLLLAGLDLFVLASVRRSEGMPTAILEAMAAGKPVVASDVGAVRELVEDGVSGLVVPPEDPEALAAALLRLIDDPDLRGRIGRAALERARDRYDLGALARRHARAYELALAHRRAAG